MNKKEALDKTIQQWQMMVDNPKMTKGQAYININTGNQFKKTSNFCFLCDNLHCSDCIEWNKDCKYQVSKSFSCMYFKSPYLKWVRSRSKEDTLKMLEFLKTARKMLS